MRRTSPNPERRVPLARSPTPRAGDVDEGDRLNRFPGVRMYAHPSPPRWALDVTSELVTERGEHLFREGVLFSGTEPRVEGAGEAIRGNRFLHRRLDGPPPLARVVDESGVSGKQGGLPQRRRREVEQPRPHDASPAPQLGHLGNSDS